MSARSRENPDIRAFIMDHVAVHPDDIASLTAQKFSVSRVTANRYLQRLVEDGVLEPTGNTRARTYKIKDFLSYYQKVDVSKNREEDVIYRINIEPHLENIPTNVREIIQHGCNEMINNVIDHSESELMLLSIRRNSLRTRIMISDEGVGVFAKIKNAHKLMDERHAILELSKGKLTTDPSRHSGEGIFFTSRMFSRFCLSSGELYYRRTLQDDDEWLIEAEDTQSHISGTSVLMEIDNSNTHSIKEIFNKYEDDDYGFKKTHVPVRLAKYGQELLVSRSQARRVLARFEAFTEVMLDFKGVDAIGQAFADEIFRVYANEHPQVAIIPVRTTEEVDSMIRHVTNNRLIVAGALSENSPPV